MKSSAKPGGMGAGKPAPRNDAAPGAAAPAANLLTAACALVIALHAAGCLWPGHLFWGVHLFSFYPPLVGWIALALCVSLLVQVVRVSAGEWMDAVVRRLSALPSPVVNAGLIAVLLFLGYRFAAEMHLLGDGAILIRSIPKSTWGDEVISSFRNQPLLSVIYKWAMDLDLSSSPATHPKEVYTVIDMAAGAAMVLLVSWFTGKLQRPPAERFLLGLFVFAGAGTQFFFGYVENYVLQYVATIAYAMTGWLALERRVHIAVPLLILAVLPGFNLGTSILLPSGLYLLYARFSVKPLKALAILGGMAAAGIGVLFIAGFDFGAFIGKFTGKAVDFLPVFATSDGNFPYTMFSGWHLLDWFNAHSLSVPLGIFIPAALLWTIPKEGRWKNPSLNFLLILTACGLAFTWIVNSALGMARDWDMLSSYFIPLVVLDVYLLVKSPALEPRRPALVMAALIPAVHLAAFIGINADAERHLARVRTLGDDRLLSRASQMWFDEALANYFFDNQRYAEAKGYYEHYMTIDSSNTRIIGNISDVYRKVGDKENYFLQLKRGTALGSRNAGMYSNLGVEYSSRGDTAQALYWNLKAVEIDSNHQSANANLGILYMGKKEYGKSDFYFNRAIAAGFREPKVFLFAAESAVLSKRYPLALKYYEAYLERSPDDQRARQQRDRLREMLGLEETVR